MNGKFWTEQEDLIMRKFYPCKPMRFLIKKLGRTECSIYNRANTLNLAKSEEYLASPEAFRFRREQTEAQKANRFQKGHETWNKGLKGICIGGEATQFKKGSKPQNHKPVGTTRITADGYKEIKIAEGMNKWRLFHRVVWERLNGKIPKNYNLIFRDGNRQNFAITNLTLVTRAQNMKRNTLHNYPKEVALLIQLQGALNRQINMRTKQNEQHRHA